MQLRKYQLQDRDAENSEHQMAHHFFRPPQPGGAAAVVVLYAAIDSFRCAAFTVTNLFRHAMPNAAFDVAHQRELSAVRRGVVPRIHRNVIAK